MLLEIFVLPSSGKAISRAGLGRLVNSVGPYLCNSFTQVADITDINRQPKEKPFYAVFYDNEYLDPRLVKALPTFLICSQLIDMLCVFLYTQGAEKVVYMPRIFKSNLLLGSNPQILLPVSDRRLVSEKILDGFLYRD